MDTSLEFLKHIPELGSEMHLEFCFWVLVGMELNSDAHHCEP